MKENKPKTHMEETMANFGLEKFTGYYNYLTKTLQPLLLGTGGAIVLEYGAEQVKTGLGYVAEQVQPTLSLMGIDHAAGQVVEGAGYLAGQAGSMAGQAVENLGYVAKVAQKHGVTTAAKSVTQGIAAQIGAAGSTMGQMYEQGQAIGSATGKVLYEQGGQAAEYIASGAAQLGKSAVQTVLANKTASIAAAVTVALLAYAGYKYYSKSSELASTKEELELTKQNLDQSNKSVAHIGKMCNDKHTETLGLKEQLQKTQCDLDLEEKRSEGLEAMLAIAEPNHQLEILLLGNNPEENRDGADKMRELCKKILTDYQNNISLDSLTAFELHKHINDMIKNRSKEEEIEIKEVAEELVTAIKNLAAVSNSQLFFETGVNKEEPKSIKRSQSFEDLVKVPQTRGRSNSFS